MKNCDWYQTVRRASAALAFIALAGNACPPGIASAAPQSNPPTDSFLYVRHNAVNGAAETDTLAVVSYNHHGFTRQDLYTQNNLDVGVRLLGVFGGNVYLLKINDLLCVDMADCRCTKLAGGIESYAYGDGRLYVIRGGGLQEFDFRKGASHQVVSDIPPATPTPDSQLQLSPDGARLAYFTHPAAAGASGSLHPVVVDLEEGSARTLARSVTFSGALTDSFAGGAPPCVWLDSRTLLAARTRGIDRAPAQPGGAALINLSTGRNVLSTIDVETGEIQDLADVPGSGMFDRLTLERGAAEGAIVRRFGAPTGEVRYAVDPIRKRLIESEALGGGFKIHERAGGEDLFYGDKALGKSASSINYTLSPDTKRILWMDGSPDAELNFFDADEGTFQVAARGWLTDNRLWFDTAASKPVETLSALPVGWTGFQHSVYPEPRAPDTRRSMSELISFRMTSDKPEYALHEPVQLTTTITNKGPAPITASRPRMDARIVDLAMKYPGGSRLVDRFWGSDTINPMERAILAPGKSISITEALEVASPGNYTLTAQLSPSQFPDISPDGRWDVPAAHLSFTVSRTPDAENRLRLKMDRLLHSLKDEQARDPSWDGWLPASDDLSDVGPAAQPYLLAWLRKGPDRRIADQLSRALARVADRSVLGFYGEELKGSDADRQQWAIRGIAQLLARDPGGKETALPMVLSALGAAHPGAVRRAAADILAPMDDLRVVTAFETALGRDDPVVRAPAALYLSHREELSLADWLERAAATPTPVRLLVAQTLTRELQDNSHPAGPPALAGLQWKDLGTKAGMAQYRVVLNTWSRWVRLNPRTADGILRKTS